MYEQLGWINPLGTPGAKLSCELCHYLACENQKTVIMSEKDITQLT